ncbi:hypothetical protein [Streptomyces sp. Tu 3180]|uniref:hypothetical protein n=1 Tax=Streptomyces sp. Tu 3180 TaxID=2682611 RepID=UPI001AA04F45|nr:hypothetical protein [Streptomyces sp. Tu 3180]
MASSPGSPRCGIRGRPLSVITAHAARAFTYSHLVLGRDTRSGIAAGRPRLSEWPRHQDPTWRINTAHKYGFSRDIGYAAGALVAGILADALGLNATVIAAAVLTAASGLLTAHCITEHRPGAQ